MLSRKVNSSHEPPPTIQRTKKYFVNTYRQVGQLRRREKQQASPILISSYIIDTFLQDIDVKNNIYDLYDFALTVKDTLDSGFIIGDNVRRAWRVKQQTAFIKLMYMFYKFMIYKAILIHIVMHQDWYIRLTVDFFNLYLDQVIT